MKTIDFPHPIYGILPTYYGIFEDNDHQAADGHCQPQS